jgi:hypothetical protein
MAGAAAGAAGRTAGVLDAEVLFAAGARVALLDADFTTGALLAPDLVALAAALGRDLRSAFWAFFGVAASLPLRASTFFGALAAFA